MKKSHYDGEAGGIIARVNGEMELLAIKIPPETVHHKLEQLIKEAVNRAMKNAKNDMAQKLGRMTGNFPLPQG